MLFQAASISRRVSASRRRSIFATLNWFSGYLLGFISPNGVFRLPLARNKGDKPVCAHNPPPMLLAISRTAVTYIRLWL